MDAIFFTSWEMVKPENASIVLHGGNGRFTYNEHWYRLLRGTAPTLWGGGRL
ncbi:MAG TPA: hypothetical protein PKD90_09310 [Phnomibacter sp.]|nr:hypothetical protein [Phnomibacter sp.]